MIETGLRSDQTSATGGNSTIIQFLSLYLLVLAFFIVLVSISTFEKVKSNAVMDSLNSTFATVLPPSTELTVFTAKAGRILGAQEFQDKVQKLFETTLGVEKVEIVQPGRLMRVIMQADSLFDTDSDVIREAKRPLIDRLIASLSGRPPGFQFDMEFVVGSEFVGENALPIGQTLEMRRAGSFVRAMLSRGVPPDSISICMRHKNPDQVVMWFYVRSPEVAVSYYRHLIQAAETIDELPEEIPEEAPVREAPSAAPTPTLIPIPAPTPDESKPVDSGEGDG